jgi:hypothetical protein
MSNSTSSNKAAVFLGRFGSIRQESNRFSTGFPWVLLEIQVFSIDFPIEVPYFDIHSFSMGFPIEVPYVPWVFP